MAQSRIRRLKTVLRERGLDAFIVSSLHHVRYLTGFSGSNALCIVGRSGASFITDSRYTEQSSREVRGCRRFVSTLELFECAAAEGLLNGARRVGFDGNSVTYAQYRRLKRLFPAQAFRSTSRLVEDLALVKDAAELGCIRRAVRISDRVFLEILNRVRPGVREREIAAEIGYLQKKYGGEGDAFESTVAAGARGALPHARATGRKIRNGEFLTLDFGCIVGGYRSDLSRTVAVGRATRPMKKMYEAVLAAQRAAIDAAHGGMWAKDLDAVARNVLRASGYGNHFTHALGHGLGLQIHEWPRVSPLSRERLRTGSVITIEPGVYIPGVGGVRIEDDIVLTDDGCRVLNKAPKDLIIV